MQRIHMSIVNSTVLFCFLMLCFCLISCDDPDNSDNETTTTTSVSAGGDNATGSSKPDSLPAFKDLHLYSSESPLNMKIPDDPEIDPDSGEYVNLLVVSAQEGGFLIELKQYNATVFFADADTPKTDVWLACGRAWGGGVEYFRDIPIPFFAEPTVDFDGSLNPILPGRCGATADQDNQMVILDLDTRCEYDLFQARMEEGQWVAGWANSISMDSIGIYEKGLSARGSGFTTLAGVIWPDELENGYIDHALIFSYPHARAGGPVAPATESDGLSKRQYALPEGALLQLDPTLDLETITLTPEEKTVAKALQEYGMYLVDDGSFGVSIEAVNPASVEGNPYEGLLPDVDYPELNNIPLDRLRVLKLGPQDPDADSTNELVSSGCGYFE